MTKRKAEEEIRGESQSQSMWNHGERWVRGALIGQVMAVKSAELSASESIQHEAAVLFEIKGCPFIIERFGEETTTTDKGHEVYNLLLEFAAGGTLDGLIQRSNGHGLPEAEVKSQDCRFWIGKEKQGEIQWMERHSLVSIPEAFKDEKQDQSSDIWSLGCIVFEMLAGKSPWELKPGFDDLVDSYDVKMLDHLRTSKIPAGISYMAMDFLKSCLATKPGKRLTAEELLSRPFLARPQPTKPGHVKVKLVNSALGHTYGVCFLKRSAEYHASGAIVPRIQPAPGFGIQAGV